MEPLFFGQNILFSASVSLCHYAWLLPGDQRAKITASDQTHRYNDKHTSTVTANSSKCDDNCSQLFPRCPLVLWHSLACWGKEADDATALSAAVAQNRDKGGVWRGNYLYYIPAGLIRREGERKGMWELKQHPITLKELISSDTDLSALVSHVCYNKSRHAGKTALHFLPRVIKNFSESLFFQTLKWFLFFFVFWYYDWSCTEWHLEGYSTITAAQWMLLI